MVPNGGQSRKGSGCSRGVRDTDARKAGGRQVKLWIKIIACIAAYLIGSINFAVIFSRIRKTDIKKVGSGNPGTMNVLRTVGKGWGVLTFVCDALKGVLFALIGRFAFDQGMDWLFILGLIAVIGHIFPIFGKFRGGKGVATSMGVYIVAYPIVGTIVLACLIVMLFVIKYGFIGSLAAESVMCVYSCVVMRSSLTVILISIAIWLLVLISHRSNIGRLVKGKENRLDLTKKPSVDDAGESVSETDGKLTP